MAADLGEVASMDATTPDGEASAPVSDNAQEYVADVEVESTQYREISQSFSVPTKNGEEAVAETQFEDDRPRTAGSTRSGQSELGEDDQEFLKDNQTPKDAADGQRQTFTPPRSSTLFVRQDMDDEITAPPSFSFAPVNKKQLDLTGNRKGPAAGFSTLAESVPAQDTIVPAPDAQGPSQQPELEQLAPSHHVVGAEHIAAAAEAEQVAPPEGKKKKKKRKKVKRYDTAPTEPPNQDAPAAPSELITIDQTAEACQTNGPGELQANVDDSFEPALEYPAPATPAPTRDDDAGYDAAPSSPNDQLRDDLEAAAFLRNLEVAGEGDDAQMQGTQEPYLEDRVEEQPSPAPTATNTAPTVRQGDAGTDSMWPHVQPGQHSRSRVASRSGAGRVTKPKSNVSRRATAPVPVETFHSDQSTSDVNDYLQILAYKMKQKKQTASSRHVAEQDALRAQLQQIVDEKQTLQDDLDAVQQQKATLTANLNQQQAKVAAYEAKLSRFRTFVDGLGNDVDALRRDAGVTRRKGEQLVQDNDERKAEQAALFEQLATCAEKSAQLKDKALKACQDAQSEIQAAQFRSDYLEQQLSERSGLLAEERDRRSQLERQLITDSRSEEKVLRVLKSSNDSMLDKLYEIHATLEASQAAKKDAEMSEKTMAAIQALTTQDSSNADELVSVKRMVESLAESVAGFLETAPDRLTDESSLATLQAALDEAFKSLKADLSQREQQVQEEAKSREQLNSLQDKLKASDDRCDDLQKQLSEVLSRETEVKTRAQSLQTRITALQNNATSDETTNAQLDDLKTELDNRTKVLDNASSDLERKREEINNLKTSNSRLQEDLATEKRKAAELQTQLDTAKLQAEGLEQHYKSEIESAVKKQSVHTEEYIAIEKMKIENEVHGLNTDLKTAREKIKPLQNENNSIKAKLQELQKSAAALEVQKESEATRLKEQAQSAQQKVESLQAQLASFESAMKGDRSFEQQYKAVKTQLETEEKSRNQISNEKSTLVSQKKDLEKALQSMQTAEQQAKSELAAHQEEHHTALNEAQQQLAQAEQECARAEEGIEKVKLQCNEAIEAEKARGEKHLDALQQRLSEVETELENEKQKAEEFRVEVDEAWRHEDHEQKKATEAMSEKVKHADQEKAEAMSECARLRQTVEQLARKQAADTHAASHQPSIVASDRVVQATGKHEMREGITPTPSNKENEPPRPRKKVDRNANALVDADPIPVPEMLRPDSRARSSEGQARGPVVEESQLRDITRHANVLDPSYLQKVGPLSMLSDNSEDMLDTASLAKPRYLPEVIEETQFDDKLPSFAAFNTSMASSQPLRRKGASSVFSVPSIHGALSQSSKPVQTASKTSKLPAALPNPPSFTIFEDDQRSQQSMSVDEMSSTRQRVKESLMRTEAEVDRYTYRKPMPQSNSASKMVRPKETELTTYHHKERDTRTPAPQIRGEGRSSAGSHGPQTMRAITQSSSPDFIHDATYSGRKMSTYHTPGGGSGSKRRTSRTSVAPTADPRLAKREVVPSPAPKRKSGGQVVEGYEHERKKRKSAESAAATDSDRYSLRGAAQPSIRDLPAMPGATSSRNNIPRGAVEPRSRMQTFGGAGARVGRGKKASKADDFDARFVQELSRR